MSNEQQNAAENGVALGRLAGRTTAVALALYVGSLVYRTGEERIALALGGVAVLYALASISRDLRYGYFPWEPVEWRSIHPDELDTQERRRATRWTVGLNVLLTVGAVGGLAGVFVAGLETLGYVLLVGGLPALLVESYRHYSNDTRPWYPSVPSQVLAER